MYIHLTIITFFIIIICFYNAYQERERERDRGTLICIVYMFRPARSYKDASPAFCRVWHTERNRVISRFFFRRGVRCTMGPIAVIGHDLYLNTVYPAVSSNMARKSPIHGRGGVSIFHPATFEDCFPEDIFWCDFRP